MIRRLFRKPDAPDTRPRFAYRDPAENVVLRPAVHPVGRFGAEGFIGAAYAVDRNGMSRVWVGAERYDDERIALLAARRHIRNAMESLLATTPEQRFPEASFDLADTSA